MSTSPPQHAKNRQTWSMVALILAIVLAPVAFLSHHTVVLATDTERVTGAIEPLIDNPDIQEKLVGTITDPLEEFLTGGELLQSIVEWAGLDIQVPGFLDDVISDVVTPIVDRTIEQVRAAIGQIISSETFARSWRQIVADTHQEFSTLVTADSDQPSRGLTMSFQPFLDDVRSGLVDRGFTFLEGAPLPEARVTVLQAETVESLRGWVTAADRFEPWGAWLIAGLIVVGVVSSPKRPVAWAVAGGGVALSMVSVVALLWLGRTVVIPLRFEATSDIAFPIVDALLVYPTTQALLIAVIATTLGAVGWFVESRVTRQKAMT